MVFFYFFIGCKSSTINGKSYISARVFSEMGGYLVLYDPYCPKQPTSFPPKSVQFSEHNSLICLML